MLVIAGGFSYADALGAGRMFALRARAPRSATALREFVAAGKPVIGICNGFQVLTRTGLLPGALGHNAERPLRVPLGARSTAPASRCIWTVGHRRRSTARSPTARAATPTPTPSALAAAGQVALRYARRQPQRLGRRHRRRVRRDRARARADAPPGEPRRRPPAPGLHRSGERRPTSGWRCSSRAFATPRSVEHDPHRSSTSSSPLADRRDGKVPCLVRRTATTTACSSPPTGCRRSTGSIAGVPYKGQVLNQLAAWWFARTADIVANHVVDRPRPERARRPRRPAAAGRGRRARLHHRRHQHVALAAVRRRGSAPIYGHRFPDGLPKNTALPAAIVTPTTKAEHGGHDEPLTRADVVEQGPRRRRRCGSEVEDGGARAVRPRPAGGRRSPA